MDPLSTDFVGILTELLTVPSPPGCEELMAAIIRERLDRMGYGHETDPAGNVIVRIPGRDTQAPPTIIAAHMDEIAMVVTSIGADGNLEVMPSGGLIPCKLGEAAVTIISDTGELINAVFSMGSTHTSRVGSGPWAPGWQDVQVITGLSPEQLAGKGVRVGSSIVPAKEGRGPYIFGDDADPMVAAWTFDDRAGVIELLLVLKQLKRTAFVPAAPLLFAFTVHEEGGCHGAKVLARREKPDLFIAVDGCPVIEPDGLKLDGRPAAWSKDTLCVYTQSVLRAFIGAAARVGIELQVATYDKAASDASAVYSAGLAPQIGFIGHVRTNSHGFEVAKLSVFADAVKVIVEYVTATL